MRASRKKCLSQPWLKN